MNTRRQSGMTLVIALVMLIVLSLLVVSAIRFGNVNLRISGNVQSEAEAAAAAQVAVESTIKVMVGATNISGIAAVAKSVSTGGQTYTVSVSKPACTFTKNIDTATLNPKKVADQACFENTDTDKQVTSGGTLTVVPSACKDQQWDVAADVDDPASGAKVSVLQGVSVRVGAEVTCP